MSNQTSAAQTTTLAGGVEIIKVPNTLALKVGPGFRSSGASAVAKAEKAMEKLASNFGAWLEQEVAQIEAVRATLKQSGLTAEVAQLLSVRALDLKGLGTTYRHPLITSIGASLFLLLDEARVEDVPVKLIDAHVDAVRAIVRKEIRDPAHPLGQALVAELESQVRELIAAESPKS